MTDQRQPMPSNTQASVDAALKQAGVTPPAATDPGGIGPYLPLGLLGTGGMGRVYLARPIDGTPGLAAVKVIRPEYADDPRFRRRFEREAALHGRVRTARAPQLLGTGFNDSLLWMATQYLPGLNLADAVRACGPLDVDGLWRLVSDLGHALSALAVAGIVHRDLKPSNVVLSQQGAHIIDLASRRPPTAARSPRRGAGSVRPPSWRPSICARAAATSPPMSSRSRGAWCTPPPGVLPSAMGRAST